jgi:lipoprotein-anchoring transpeptidase ErfK/SrfK
MWRLASTALACFVLAVPAAQAQSRNWVPWGEIGVGPSRPAAINPGRPPFAGARPIGPRSASIQRRYADEEEDDDSIFAAPRGQYPKSAVRYPAVLEGGGRPDISPQAPGQIRFASGYGAGNIVIDTSARALYYITSSTTAYKYPISVGREGFTWRGTEKISRVQSWPDWRPPAEMRQRDPNLPELMTGGVNNPLGAKALYLGNTLYRIHGTNDSRTIGYAASSGCFRMMNSHVLHLATLAGPGTTVHVLDRLPRNVASVN